MSVWVKFAEAGLLENVRGFLRVWGQVEKMLKDNLPQKLGVTNHELTACSRYEVVLLELDSSLVWMFSALRRRLRGLILAYQEGLRTANDALQGLHPTCAEGVAAARREKQLSALRKDLGS